MSIILMDLDTMELYKTDIIQSRDRDEKCMKDAWIQFAFDNTLQVGNKVRFSFDFDLNSLFAELVKHVPQICNLIFTVDLETIVRCL
jgi:hypothetical protein